MNEYQFLTPEMLAQLVGPDIRIQQEDIEHQRALAQALMGQQPHHTTAMGGMFGALAQALNGYQSGKTESAAQKRYDALVGQDQKQREAALQLMQQMAQAKALQGQGQAPQTVQEMYSGAPSLVKDNGSYI